MGREHALKEAGIAIHEMDQEFNDKYTEKKNSILKELNEAAAEREAIKENFRNAKSKLNNYKDKVYTEMLSVALKGIYISALQEHMIMSEEGYKIAENVVDKFINENGGVYSVLDSMKETYLLDTVRKFVIEASEDAIEDSTDDDKEINNIPDEPKEKLLDKLENEEDVTDAVHIISDRIAAAEEEFIKKNKEDKEKIESIVNDINDRIKAVNNDPGMNEEDKEEIQKEYAIKQKKQIKMVYENRDHSVFEQMIHNLSKSIVSDAETKSMYTTESGKLDIDHVVDTTKCLYGFMEFVNTTGLVKVDEKYISETLKNM